jgi:hypothetical protein
MPSCPTSAHADSQSIRECLGDIRRSETHSMLVREASRFIASVPAASNGVKPLLPIDCTSAPRESSSVATSALLQLTERRRGVCRPGCPAPRYPRRNPAGPRRLVYYPGGHVQRRTVLHSVPGIDVCPGVNQSADDTSTRRNVQRGKHSGPRRGAGAIRPWLNCLRLTSRATRYGRRRSVPNSCHT